MRQPRASAPRRCGAASGASSARPSLSHGSRQRRPSSPPPSARARRARSRPRARPRTGTPSSRQRRAPSAAMAANPVVGHHAVGQRVLAWASKPAETSISCGCVGPRQRHAHVLDQRAEVLVAGARRHRQVDRVAGPGARMPTSEAGPVPGIQRRLVDRDEQHLAGRRGRCRWCRCRGAHPSRGSSPARAPRAVERVAGGDRHVVEQAEAHRPGGSRVVAGRPVGAEARGERRRRAAGRRARPPRRRRAAPPSNDPGADHRVGVDLSRRPPPHARSISSTWRSGWTRLGTVSIDGRGERTRS